MTKDNFIRVADRRDYVISCVTNPIAAATGPVSLQVSLDSLYPWMWTGFYLGSVFSSTASGGGVVAVQPTDLTFQILDSNRNYLFSDFFPADTINYAVTSSNVATGQNRNEIFIISPEQPQPAGGSFLVYANNKNQTGNLYFELIFTGYAVKDDCLKTKPPSRLSPDWNQFHLGRMD